MNQHVPWTPPPARREPFFNAPWIVLALVGVLVAAHGARLGLNLSPDGWALFSDDLKAGRWIELVTYQLVHADGWAHVLMNSAACLAFGVLPARAFGQGLRGSAVFLVFFLGCGVIAALAYAGVHPQGPWVVVGASGSASALFGATARLMTPDGRPAPFSDPRVLGMTVAFILSNAALGLFGLTPGAAGLPVAWEAHIAGCLAGLALVGPAWRLAGGHGAITH